MTVITAQIYEISELFYQKGNNSKTGDNSDKKKNKGHLYFHEESTYEISKHYSAYMVLNLIYAHECNK